MGNPLLGSLIDAFLTGVLNTAQWNSVITSTVTMVPALGMAQLACPTASGTNTLGANGPYDATGGTLYAQVTPVLRGNGGTRTVMKILIDANNSVAIRLTAGVFTATSQTGGTTTTYALPTYDPTAHAWWRLRELSGTFYAETSTDGYAWTTLATMPYGWVSTAVQAIFQTGASDTEPAGLFAGFSNVNTMADASGLMPSWPQIRFQVAFSGNASMSLPAAYVDLSSRLRGPWSAQQSGRQYELDQIQSGQLALTLSNKDGAFDPLNTASPYAPNVLPMKPCRLQAIWPPSRNLLPQGFTNGSSTAAAQITSGSLSLATVSAMPTGLTTAHVWSVTTSAPALAAIGLGSGNTAFTLVDSSAFPVVAGQTYTLSANLSAASGGSTTQQITPRLSWYDINGNRISTSDGTPVTAPVQPSWATVTVSGTAPAGAISSRVEELLTAVPTAATTLYFTGWQLEQGAAATPWTAGGVVYPLWAGYVERWPQQWDQQGTYGLNDITAVDALATLANFKMSPNTIAQLLALNPTRLYPLDDAQGTRWWRSLVASKGALFAAASPLGAGTITAGTSVTGTGFVGAPGPVTNFANPAPSNFSGAGSYLSLGNSGGPPTSGGWTRLVCFRTTTVPTSANMTLWNATASNSGSSASLYIDSNQYVNAQVTSAAGHSISTYVPTAVCDGNWHMAAMILTPDGLTLNINVDGAGYYNTSTYDCHTSGITTDTLGMNVGPVARYYGNAYSGDLAYVAEVATNNVPSFSDIAAGFSTGWSGEISAARAQRILSLSGYQGPLGTQDATTAMGGASLAGQDAMSALQLVADSENGQVYVDGSGTVQLSGRLWRYYQSAPALLIGEQQAGGEIPYLADIAIDMDTTHIYNQVSVTNQSAPGAPQQPAATQPNNASSTAYAPRTLPRTINVLDPTVPQYAAQYLAQQYGQPLPRVAQLTIDPASNPALWSTVLALGYGSRVQVSRRPPPAPGAQPIVVQQFVEHLAWDGDAQGKLRATMQLSSATPHLGWWVVSSLHSTLQVQATAGASTITLGALTGSALNPAVAVLPAGTVFTVGYGTAAAEQVTVQSVGATVAGYTSVVITLTAALVSTHAAGLVVCQPLPSGYTLPALPAATFPASLDAGATLSAIGPRVTY